MNYIIAYTDGACTNNQNKKIRRGGYGVHFSKSEIENCSIKLTGDKITNQVAELSACLYAIEKCIEYNVFNNIKHDIIIKTDSMYIINSITVWCKGWEKKGWKKADNSDVENLELIKKIYNYYNNICPNEYGITIKFYHVRAHQKEPSKDDPKYNDWYGNMMADKLATDAANN
jgi:ribonuclease HI